MNNDTSRPQRFLVTTPGLSATRWLSFALASHPEVFAAHGKHSLDSVIHGQFVREKHIDDVESLTHGNLAAEFYERESLDGIFAAYRDLMPRAKAIGNVHTFTLEALMKKVKSEDELRGIHIVNVLRHPVRYISSHTALVQSAEQYPLYGHYTENLFPQAMKEFPELLLLDCEDFGLFLAFAVSCFSVRNLAHDFQFPGFKSVQMEAFTTQVDLLKSICEEITGLEYSKDRLEEFIGSGAINQHRKQSVNESAWQVYRGWRTWQQDLARMMIPSSVLEAFEEAGYDVSMLRVEDCSTQSATGPTSSTGAIPSLADCLRGKNPEHPLLALRDSHAACAPPQLIKEAYKGFNLLSFRGSCYALAQSLGPFDLLSAADDCLRSHRETGLCFIGDSAGAVKEQINRVLPKVGADVPDQAAELVRENFHGFNIVCYKNRFYALAQALGPFDLASARSDGLEKLQRSRQCLVDETYLDLLERIEQLLLHQTPTPAHSLPSSEPFVLITSP